jgi:hypothetical protein
MCGGEIAVGNVPEAEEIINRYLQEKYGSQAPNEPVVRQSRLAADDTYYTAVLVTPEIAGKAVSPDEEFTGDRFPKL